MVLRVVSLYFFLLLHLLGKLRRELRLSPVYFTPFLTMGIRIVCVIQGRKVDGIAVRMHYYYYFPSPLLLHQKRTSVHVFLNVPTAASYNNIHLCASLCVFMCACGCSSVFVLLHFAFDLAQTGINTNFSRV